MAKKKSPNPQESKIKESKQQRFVRLATSRVTKAVKSIHNIGNLGGVGYESTEEQRTKVKEALETAVQIVLNRLNKEQVKPTGFTL